MNSKEKTENRLIKFHIKNQDTYFYKTSGIKIHERLLNLYNQRKNFPVNNKNEIKPTLKRTYSAINAACRTINKAYNLNFVTEEYLIKFIKNKKGVSPYITEDTANNYASSLFEIWGKSRQ